MTTTNGQMQQKTTTIRPDHFDQIKKRTHILYRCFNRKNVLLYIGMTNHPETRFNHHKQHKVWWKYVDHITLQKYPTRKLLIEAEAAAIQLEKPRFNISTPTGAIPEATTGRRGSTPLWSEPSAFGTIIADHSLLIHQTLEQQMYPCLACHAKAIYCEDDMISCSVCSTEWSFDDWFKLTFGTTQNNQ